jgi:hypothetical protein
MTRLPFLRCALAGLAALPLPLAAEPLWWSASGTTIWASSPVNLENNAPVNVGQLKHGAAMARRHLQAALAPAGGEGPAIAAFVDGFTTGDPANAAPINVGQLKHTAALFYDRLAAAGWNWQTGSFGTATAPYPWTGTVHPENGLAANIGQLKNVFSFELTQDFLVEDNDGDGIPSWWESVYQLDPNSDSDAQSDADLDGLSNTSEFEFASSPRSADTDHDWASDAEEKNAFTDPRSDASAPLVLCYVEDVVRWDVHHSGYPFGVPDWDETFHVVDSSGRFERAPGQFGISDPIPNFALQAGLVQYPDINAWSKVHPQSGHPKSEVYFDDQNTEGNVETTGARFWLRGLKQPFPVTRVYKQTLWRKVLAAAAFITDTR